MRDLITPIISDLIQFKEICNSCDGYHECTDPTLKSILIEKYLESNRKIIDKMNRELNKLRLPEEEIEETPIYFSDYKQRNPNKNKNKRR